MPRFLIVDSSSSSLLSSEESISHSSGSSYILLKLPPLEIVCGITGVLENSADIDALLCRDDVVPATGDFMEAAADFFSIGPTPFLIVEKGDFLGSSKGDVGALESSESA